MSDQGCAPVAGRVMPRIDLARCEGKGDCERVCPYDVFVIAEVPCAERRTRGAFARAKLWVHGNRQAVAINADACHACGRCVAACPEDAIRLVPR
jgi:NAD-dependent dihydropyrimidine dehydrogenase PreA subunit